MCQKFPSCAGRAAGKVLPQRRSIVLACISALWATFLTSTLAFAAQPTLLHFVVWEPLNPAAEKAIRALCRNFRATHPNISLTIVRHPIEDAPRLLRYWSHQASWAPDIALTSALMLTRIASGLRHVPEAAVRTLRTHASEAFVQRIRVDERIVAVPWWLEPRLLFYWRRFIHKRQWQPQSWDEVAEQCAKAARQYRVFGIGIPGSGLPAMRFFAEVLWSLGGSLYNAEGRLDLSTIKAEQALETILKIARSGTCQPEVLTWSQEEIEEKFLDRKIAAIVARASLEKEIRQVDEKGYGVAALPGNPRFVSVAMDCLVSFDHCEQPAAAAEFLTFAVSRQAQACVVEAGGISFYRELMQRAASNKNSRAAGLLQGELRFLPRDEWWAISMGLDRALYLALSGRRSAARALEEAQAIFEQAVVSR